MMYRYRLCILLSIGLFFGACSNMTQKEQRGSKQGCTCPCPQDTLFTPLPSFDQSGFRFLVTGDPQYNEEEMNPDGPSVQNSDRLAQVFFQKICCHNYEGLVIAGDLTHNARLVELNHYRQSIGCYQSYVFDGIGNHDFAWINNAQQDVAAFARFGLNQILPLQDIHWPEACLEIWQEVRDRKRIPSVNGSFPNIHYSWDWEEIHFVQLNISPSEQPVTYKPAQHPFQAFSFLKKDLEEQVGRSGRPVILVHHYGLDAFSRGLNAEGQINPLGEWWTAAARQRYWTLLADYNVIAIFSGHAHYCDDCYLPWDGQQIGVGEVGPHFIPTFIAGAAREGKYLDCQITTDSLIIHRIDQQQLIFRKAFAIQRPVK
ncbi:MAG: metallophosphoesterase [Bacteroidota bacterium]